MSVTISQIQALVAERYRVCKRELLSRRRSREVIMPRQAAMWLARHITPCSMPEIGRAFDRDHTTVMHGVDRIDKMMGANSVFAEAVLALMHELSPADCAEYRMVRGLP